MRIGVSILLIAVGAMLRFALETSVEGIDLSVAGVILMIVGGLGLVISVLMSSLNSARRPSDEVEHTVVHETTTTPDREIT